MYDTTHKKNNHFLFTGKSLLGAMNINY